MSAWVAVEPGDISGRWRPLTSDESTIAPTLIEDAQDELEDALSDMGFDGPPSPTNERWERRYVRTVVAMVRRVLTNPDGYLSETIDGYEYRRDKAISTGALYVSESEIQKFRKHPSRSSFTISPS